MHSNRSSAIRVAPDCCSSCLSVYVHRPCRHFRLSSAVHHVGLEVIQQSTRKCISHPCCKSHSRTMHQIAATKCCVEYGHALNIGFKPMTTVVCRASSWGLNRWPCKAFKQRMTRATPAKVKTQWKIQNGLLVFSCW